MNVAQISALLRPFVALSGNQLAQTLIYIDLLLKWNSRINLTSVRRPEDIVTRHFGESFFAASQLLASEEATSVIDLGSGAGFPGIPLAMAFPEAHVTLVEAASKKAAFLNEVIRALQLTNAKVFNGRGEDCTARANLVTLRAVEKFEATVPLASGMIEPQGRLALMIGRNQIEKAKELAPQLAWADPIMIPGGHSRVLFVGTAPSLRNRQ